MSNLKSTPLPSLIVFYDTTNTNLTLLAKEKIWENPIEFAISNRTPLVSISPAVSTKKRPSYYLILIIFVWED